LRQKYGQHHKYANYGKLLTWKVAYSQVAKQAEVILWGFDPMLTQREDQLIALVRCDNLDELFQSMSLYCAIL
jgi:hypothetical protein